jgi:hypothetical protein
MQSPKLMMFNGQAASLTAGYSQVFVSGVQIAAQGLAGGPLFVPNATVQNFGTNINVQPVVTGDRRFVRVNVALQLTNPIAQVPVFPIVVTVQPFIEGVGSVGNPSILTQFIQQPATDFIGVQTTAVVPDGGTVLLPQRVRATYPEQDSLPQSPGEERRLRPRYGECAHDDHSPYRHQRGRGNHPDGRHPQPSVASAVVI